MNLRYVLLLNLLLGAIWPALQQNPQSSDFLTGFVVGFVVLAAIHREYGRRMLAAIAFLLFLVWSIVKSSVEVARIILTPRLRLDQGIIAIPLDVQTPLEIATLATAITLTPGTLSVDIGRNASGQSVLYVHCLVVEDAEAMRVEIKEQFERRILLITREESVS